MSIKPGMNSAAKLICVPQTGQKPRFASAEDANNLGDALTKTTSDSWYIAQATAGARLNGGTWSNDKLLP
jgi:hypothetical protein